MVATDSLLAERALLAALQGDADSWRNRLADIRSLDNAPAPAWRPGDVGLAVFQAEQAAAAVAEHAGRLADSLGEAAQNYGDAERMLTLLLRSSSALAAHTAGRFAPLLSILALPALTSAALVVSVLRWLAPGLSPAPADARGGGGRAGKARGARQQDAEWFRIPPEVVSDPVFVQAVRVLVSSIDDAAAGAAGVPLPVSFTLGDEGFGLLGVSASARSVLGLVRPLGPFRETPIRVERTAVRRAPPPRGLAGLARRIPRASPGAPQVRIERYGSTRPVWVVYSGGTIDWSPIASTEPWDLTSNISSVADHQSGSYRTVVQAMKAAGVQPGDRVVQVGHSQGGLVAAQVAASAEFDTVAVATFGAPAGQVDVPAEVPMIATEHTDDLVPALGGTPNDATGADNRHLVVRREAFATGELPQGESVPAHNLAVYEETARLEDASEEPRIVAFRSDLAELLGSEPGETSWWRGTRVVGSTGGEADAVVSSSATGGG